MINPDYLKAFGWQTVSVAMGGRGDVGAYVSRHGPEPYAPLQVAYFTLKPSQFDFDAPNAAGFLHEMLALDCAIRKHSPPYAQW